MKNIIAILLLSALPVFGQVSINGSATLSGSIVVNSSTPSGGGGGTVQTNIAVVGVTNAGTIAYSNANAYVTSPTNSGTDGQFVSLTGNKTKWISVSGGGDALTGNPLSQFAATTSLQFAGVISDETGTGKVVLNTNASLATPTLIDATATSITNSALTASRIVMSDANKKEISATASGAVPIDADGTATTIAQLNALTGSWIFTNNTTANATFLATVTATNVTATVSVNTPIVTTAGNDLDLYPKSGGTAKINIHFPSKIITTGVIYGDGLGLSNVIADSYPAGLTNHQTTAVSFDSTVTATNAQLYTPALRDSQGNTVWNADNNGSSGFIQLKMNAINIFEANVSDPSYGNSIRFADSADGLNAGIISNKVYISKGGFVGNGYGITNIPGAAITNLGTIAYSNANAYTTFPTNTGTDGQFVSLTGNKTKWISVAGGGDALTGNPLSQFAFTTSLQFAGVISDETGTGLVVLNTNAQLFTPNIGNATATSVTNSALTANRMVFSDANKKEISAAASGAVPLNADGSATTFAQVNALAPSISGIFITNNGNGYTNAGNIQASSFNGNGAGITNIAATSLPPTVTTNNGTLASAVPLAGDGGRGVTAATSAGVQALFPAVIHTNGMSVGAQFSNNVALSALAFLSVSNATASRVAMLDAGTRLTNATASGAVSINADGTATTFAQINALGPNAAGIFITNNSAGFTNSGNIQASSFNGNGAALTNHPITAINGGGGANTAATNGVNGQVMISAGNGGVYWSNFVAGGSSSLAISNGLLINPTARTNLIIGVLQGATGAASTATNGTAGQVLSSSADGGVYWASPGGGSQTPWVGDINGAGFNLAAVNNLSATNQYFMKTNGFAFFNSSGALIKTNGVINTINALDYGLSASGDQTANIQSAINAAVAVTGRLFIPAGNWTVNGQLTIGGKMMLEGESGPGQNFAGTTLYAGGTASNTAIVLNSQQCAIRNISIVGDGRAYGRTGISTRGDGTSTPYQIMENVTVTDMMVGISLTNTWNVDVIYPNLYRCSNGIAMLGNANAIHIIGGEINDMTNGIYAVSRDFGLNMVSISTTIEQCARAIYMTNATGNFNIRNINIKDCYFENDPAVIYMEGNGRSIEGVSIEGCMFGFNNLTNIYLNTVTYPRIVGNDFTYPGINIIADGSSTQLYEQGNAYQANQSNQLASVVSSLMIGTNIDLKGGNLSVWNSNQVSRLIIGTNSAGFSNSRDMLEIWSPGNVELLDFDTNGWLEVTGTFSVTGGITNTAGTASRLVFTDANKKLISATASGAVPVDADGSATTIAQVNALTGSFILTNNNATATVISNTMSFSALSFVSISNATASRVAMFDTQKRMTNAGAASAASPLNSDGSATTFAQINALGPSISGIFITNNGSGYTNSGNIQAATFNGAMTITSESYPTNSGAAVAPDFTKRYQSFQTNASFVFLAPIGVQVAGTAAQPNTFYVTNSAASPIVVSPPANVRTNGGTWTVPAGGLTKFLWEVYGRMTTNCTSVPIF